MAWVRRIQKKNGRHMIVIPQVLCQKFSWKYGDNMIFYLGDDEVIRIEKVTFHGEFPSDFVPYGRERSHGES